MSLLALTLVACAPKQELPSPSFDTEAQQEMQGRADEAHQKALAALGLIDGETLTVSGVSLDIHWKGVVPAFGINTVDFTNGNGVTAKMGVDAPNENRCYVSVNFNDGNRVEMQRTGDGSTILFHDQYDAEGGLRSSVGLHSLEAGKWIANGFDLQKKGEGSAERFTVTLDAGLEDRIAHACDPLRQMAEEKGVLFDG